MATSALMTELDAINVLLVSAEQAPVADLTATGLYPLDKARGILTETSRVVQSVGWKFNTEDGYPLTRQPDGTLPLPDNLLSFDTDDSFLYSVTPVQRGARMYDSKAHSYTFTVDLTGTAVFLLEWDELPQPARHYITIRAARTMQGRSSVGEATYRYSQDEEQAAMLALSSYESEVGDHNMLRDSWSVANCVADRDLF
jgi:hypothetical protein